MSIHYSADIEWKLLQSFMMHPESLRDATRGIFTDDRVGIYDTMVEAYAQYGQLAPDIMEGSLGGKLPEELSMVNKVKPDTYINRLAGLARRRQLDVAANVLLQQANQFEPDESKVREALYFEPVLPSQNIYLHAGTKNLAADIIRKRSGTYRFATTGLKAFDHYLGGEWQRKSLTVVKARPGVGKTALVCTTMMHLAKMDIPTHLWSLEMGKEQLLIRWIASQTRIDNTKILTGTGLSESELEIVSDAAAQIANMPMTVSNSVSSMEELIADTHYLSKQGVRLFAIDYLQIVGLSRYGNRNQDLGWIAREIKELAKRHDISFLILSQMNDQGEVRDSGEVEQVADVSIGLSPGEETADTDGYLVVNAKFDKNRYGPVGKTVSLQFNGKYQFFSNMGSGNDEENE